VEPQNQHKHLNRKIKWNENSNTLSNKRNVNQTKSSKVDTILIKEIAWSKEVGYKQIDPKINIPF
jgi:phage protein U